MSRTPRHFSSPLADGIYAFISHKRSLGCRYETEEKLLALFDRYLVEQHVNSYPQITSEVLDTFIASRPRQSARSYNHLLGTVRRLLEWLVLHEYIDASPLQVQPRRSNTSYRPFLFDKSQIRELLDAAARLPETSRAPLRGDIYETVFGLLYALGLRVGEVTRLCGSDIDLEQKLLVIRQTKFGKSRLVPFGPRAGEKLRRYIGKREQRWGRLGSEHPLFTFSKDGRHPIYPNTISWTFHKLVLALKLEPPSGVASPHLHCLRHSFAVGTLLRWYREGVEPAQRLLYLSTFLGHVSPESTAVYLTITDELLQIASERYERFATPVLEEIRP